MNAITLVFVACVACHPATDRPRVSAAAHGSLESAGGQVAQCVRSWGEARYAPYGYDHVVHLVSTCEDEVRCDVSTDVDPSPLSTQVAPSEHVEVVTRRRSPSRRFEARAICYAFEG